VDIIKDLQSLNTTPKTFKGWKVTADPAEVKALEDAFKDTKHTAYSLVALCKAHGIPVSKETVMGYR
jgi:hypothetical protein